ncbi:MAG: hypothetical protein FJ090_22170 [Deltaproteobacteria bacterium]|nr:hypothetical protein [Deltaproteobacteria bacterium]
MWLARLLAACTESLIESGHGHSGDTGSHESGDCNDIPCHDCSVTQSWNTDGICLAIPDGKPGTSYLFGMAETGSGEGWYGEDCIDGPGPNSGDYDICHPIVSCESVCLATVGAPGDVVAGRTTLFTDTIASAGNITYLLGNDADCWTWGHDTRYYTSRLGCAVH